MLIVDAQALEHLGACFSSLGTKCSPVIGQIVSCVVHCMWTSAGVKVHLCGMEIQRRLLFSCCDLLILYTVPIVLRVQSIMLYYTYTIVAALHSKYSGFN